MKSKLNKRKKKKDRTWAEAATLALQMTSNKVCGIRQILETIYDKNLKDISLDKSVENVLSTMLNHHAQLPNCPFFRVKNRNGLYALKSNWLKKHGETIPPELYKYEEAGSDSVEGAMHSSTDEMFPPDDDAKNHTYSIQGKSLQTGNNKKYVFPSSLYRKKKNLLRPSSIHGRRHSSPMKIPYRSPLTPRRPPIITRASSLTSRYANTNHHLNNHIKNESNLDLESPGSVLVNANMRALVNKDTFAVLPPSYRFKLTQLLPECDQSRIDVGAGEHKILAPSDSALTNEFFTQAVQEWRERLTDGEFTRETQSRIVQEIAKERSKIEPWKEKFFEEYYGQKKVSNQRLRIRSQNLAAEAGHKMRDLGMDAQLAIFAHLRPELEDGCSDESSDSEPQISEDDDLPLQNLVSDQSRGSGSATSVPSPATVSKPTPTVATSTTAVSSSKLELVSPKPAVSTPKPAVSTPKPALPTPKPTLSTPKPALSAPKPALPTLKPAISTPRLSAPNPKPKKMSYLEKIAKTKFENSKVHMHKPCTTAGNPSLSVRSPVTSLVMRPSWSLGALPLESETTPPIPPDRVNEEGPKLTVQKRNDVKILDHSYTPTAWTKNTSSCSDSHLRSVSTTAAAPRSTTASSRSTTLVLFPNGHLVQSTIANLQRPEQADRRADASKKFEDLLARVNSNSLSNDVDKRKKSPLVALKPGLLTPAANNPDTERVLSLRARPLTPESFVSGGPKSVGVISNVARQVPSPLSLTDATPSDSLRDVQRLRAAVESVSQPTKPLQNLVSMKQANKPPATNTQTNDALTRPASSRAQNIILPQTITCAYSQFTTVAATSSKATAFPTLVRSRFPVVSSNSTPTTSCTMSYSVPATTSALTHPPHPYILSQVPPGFPRSYILPTHNNKATVTTLPTRPPLLISQPKVSFSLPYAQATLLNTTTREIALSSHSDVVASSHALPARSTLPTPSCSQALISVPVSTAEGNSLLLKRPAAEALQSPAVVSTVQSAVAPPRPHIAGAKRSFPGSQSSISSPAQCTPSVTVSPTPLKKARPFSASSLSSSPAHCSTMPPSPPKKARTLAEIKAQMKAKRAAAAVRPSLPPSVMTSQQAATPLQSSVTSQQATNTSSHLFSATTFPVYFPPPGHDPGAKLPMSHMATPATYIRLPSTATLPLEKLQWVSHHGLMGVQAQNSVQPPATHGDATPPKQQLSPVVQQKPPVTSVCTSSASSKPGRGKITLKIKAAGSAISLKVDADVIQKEKKRAVGPPSSDEDSWEEGHSDDSDRPKLFKHHRGPIKLPKVGDNSSDSDSDLDNRPTQRWSTSTDLDTGQNPKPVPASSQAPPIGLSSTVSTSLLPTKPVFGVPPFSVSITPGSTFMTSSNNYIKESLFPNNQLFTSTATSCAWSSRSKVSPTAPAKQSAASNFSNKTGRSFRSRSKGKDMENMQKLARDNLFQSDDSAESSCDDDDHADSAFSTSASEKGTESEDDVLLAPIHRRAKVHCKRHTRSSVHAEKNKPNSLDELPSKSSTMKTT